MGVGAHSSQVKPEGVKSVRDASNRSIGLEYREFFRCGRENIENIRLDLKVEIDQKPV